MAVRERHSKPCCKYYNLLNKSLHGLWCNECACLQRSAHRNADSDSDSYSNSQRNADTYGCADPIAHCCSDSNAFCNAHGDASGGRCRRQA